MSDINGEKKRSRYRSEQRFFLDYKVMQQFYGIEHNNSFFRMSHLSEALLKEEFNKMLCNLSNILS